MTNEERELHEKLRKCRQCYPYRLNEFANRVRAARLDAGIGQVALAKAVQWPRLRLVKLENGYIRMKEYECKMLLAAIAEMKRSQKPGHGNGAKEAISLTRDNQTIP